MLVANETWMDMKSCAPFRLSIPYLYRKVGVLTFPNNWLTQMYYSLFDPDRSSGQACPYGVGLGGN